METFVLMATIWGWSPPSHENGVIEFARPLAIESERPPRDAGQRMLGSLLSRFVATGMTKQEVDFILGTERLSYLWGSTHGSSGFWCNYCYIGMSISYKLDDGIWRVTEVIRNDTDYHARDLVIGSISHLIRDEATTNVGPFRFATPTSSVSLEKN